MLKKTLYYCEQCPRWAGLEVQCSKCQSSTLPKEVPKKRGGFYYIDEYPQPFVSVTAVIQVLAKPQLDYWKGQMVAQAVFDNPFISLKDAIDAPNKVRDAAASKGSDIHNIIEKHADGYPIVIEDYKDPWRAYVEAYVKFINQMPHKITFAEQIVYSKKHMYAGTADAIVDIGGKTYLLDYKTSKNLYPKDHALQLGAYKLALEEMGHRIDACAIVHLKADGTYSFAEITPDARAFLAVLYIYNYLHT